MKHEDIIALAMEAGFSTKLGAVWVDHWEVTHLIERFAALVAAALAEPPVLVVEKEPDYWSGGHFYQGSKPHIDPTKVWSLPIGTKLYTAPPQRKPLTEEEIYEMYNEPRSDREMVAFARAIERAHGIGEP